MGFATGIALAIPMLALTRSWITGPFDLGRLGVCSNIKARSAQDFLCRTGFLDLLVGLFGVGRSWAGALPLHPRQGCAPCTAQGG